MKKPNLAKDASIFKRRILDFKTFAKGKDSLEDPEKHIIKEGLNEAEGDPLKDLYNGIMNDHSIQRYTMGWKDVTAAIKKKFKTIEKSDNSFENSLVKKAIESCDDDKLKSLIIKFGKELDMNLDTYGEGNPTKR